MCHPFFDELRSADAKVASNGKAVPELFNFTKEGSSISSLGVIKVFLLCECRRTELSVRPDLISKLVPPQAEQPLLDAGIDIKNFQPLSAESCVPSLSALISGSAD